MPNRYHYAVALALTLALLAAVQTIIGWSRLLLPWQGFSATGLGTAIALAMVTYGLRALRLYDYFQADMRGHFGACLKLMLTHNLLNNLLPMRSGEISFPVLMARYYQVPALRSVPVLCV